MGNVVRLYPSVPRGRFPSGGAERAGGRAPRWRLPWLLGACLAVLPPAGAQLADLGAPAPGLIETGVPPFVVLGPEALGLATVPADLQSMPDGRLLAVGRGEFALGDGVRWDVFRQAEGDRPVGTESVAIAEDGRIYAGIPGGFGCVEFQPEGRWRLRPVERLPDGAGGDDSIPVAVEKVRDEWFWSWGSGPVVAWRPGATPRVVGRTNAPERAFLLDGVIHLSDTSTGGLFRYEGGKFRPVPLPASTFAEQTITCTVPLGGGAVLAGTNLDGLVVHEHGAARPFVAGGLLGGGHRINDLCATGAGFFAAAIDNVGIVFFDRTGRVRQCVDRSVDHRFARVRRLRWTPGGGLWALLNEGVARVAFPMRASNFEPLVSTGLGYAQLFRRQGRLWLMSDGRAQRGVYDADGRLIRFEVDSPETYVSMLQELEGEWLATARDGLHRWLGPDRWESVAPGPASAKIRPGPVAPGRWLYVAENEVGWLRHEGGRFAFDRFPVPDLGHPYSAIADGRGVYWIDLGPSKIARVEPSLPRPTVRVYGPADGLSDGWAQMFVLRGEARINLPNRILRLDPATDRFVLDDAILKQEPALRGARGRPVFDARGRLWAAQESFVQVTRAGARDETVADAIPEGLAPLYFMPQPDGVVWMHQRGRLVRFDPQLPEAAPPPLRALITRVQFPATNRELLAVAEDLPALAAGDNALVVHFLAPNPPVGRAVTFEVRLDGSDGGWFSTGTAGSVSFNHLDRGHYTLRVRPRLGDRTGREARLGFSVLAPWHRTPTAYAFYGVGGLVLVVLVGWLSACVQRREKARLGRIVAARTRELHQANEELGRQIQASLEKTDALELSEERLRRLSENAPDIIFRVRVGPPLAYDYINAAVERIAGYAPREFYADATLVERIARSDGAATIAAIAASGRLPAGMREIRWQARDGRLVTLEERLTPVFGRDGRLAAIEGIARDITGRKEAEEEIRRLSQAVEQSPVAVHITDLAGRIVFANPRMSELTGYANDELLAQTFRDLRSDLVPPELLDELWATITGGAPWHGELALRRKDGRVRHVRAAFSPLRGPDGAIVNYLALQEDITGWLDDQARRRRLEAQLFQAQKLESLGTLAGGIAHDFNNILTGILGYCELAALSAPDDSALRSDLGAIRTAGLRAKDLVARILTFSRRGESRLEAVDLATVVAEALKLVRASTPATVEIVRELDPGVIQADATQLHQIVLNLCTNGLHAMPDRAGCLTIGVHRVTADAGLCAEVPNLTPGDWLRLSVRDTGCGMDEETIARIFDPFFTTKKPGEGTGLGLPIVRGIVASHHGALRVQSRPGAGTTFEVYFPAADGAVPSAGRAEPVKSGGGREIMVVDDEPAVAQFAATRLQHFGYRVTVFHDPRAALAAFAREPWRFHAAVTDLTMPHLTGVELVRRLRALGRAVPVVIMSGFGKELASLTPATLPAAAVLTKPFSGEELAHALSGVLDAAA